MIGRKLLILILGFFIFSTTGFSIDNQFDFNKNVNIILNYRVNHSPIFINGNMDFTPENGVTRGNGTENDPYIIEGWNIPYDGITYNGIQIMNTNVFFIIRNCTISGFYNGTNFEYNSIFFDNVDNGKINNILGYENLRGIRVNLSNNILINNCSFSNYGRPDGVGISIRYCSYIDIISCIVNDENYGITTWGCNNLLIKNCEIYNTNNALEVSSWTSDFKIYNITISHCKIYNNNGIALDIFANRCYPTNILIKNCHIHHNGIFDDFYSAAIDITNAFGNTVENCTIHDNGFGVYLYHSFNIIRNCSIFNHGGNELDGYMRWGIQLASGFPIIIYPAWFDKVEHCDIYNNDIGIWLANTKFSIVEKNNIYDNRYWGVFTILRCIPRFKYNNIYGNGYDTVNFSDSAGVFQYKSFADFRHNWWGSNQGPSRFGIREGDSVKNLLGIAICFPWLLKPIPDAGILN